ncbi:MAG: DUF6966 domain-containing protein [Actinomycetota bacterium]
MDAQLTKEVVVTLKDLSRFLYDVREDSIGAFFERLSEEFASGENDTRELIQRGLSVYRGMGSFNDLVVTVDGLVDPSANRSLDLLRSRAFDLLIQGV